MKRNIRTVRSWAIIAALAAVAAAAIPSGRAVAQGTSGTLPGPIDSRQISRCADLLALSPAQRRALEEAHDDYRLQFRLLRDGEIAAFLGEQQSLQGGIPERERVERLLEQMERLQAKIALLDNALFDGLLPILSEGQQGMVPRLRLARERRRYEPQQTAASMGRRTVDLSQLYFDLDLGPDARATADGVVASYERQLTTIMRKQNRAITRQTLDMMDGLAERGYVEVSQEELLADPELLQEVIKNVGEIYTDLRADGAKLADDLRDLNERTYKQLAAVLPAAAARRLRNDYYRGTHPQLAPLIDQSENDWMTRALRLEDLTEPQREALSALAGDHQRRLEQLLLEGARRMERFWAEFSPFTLSQELAEQLGADLGQIMMEARTVQARTESELGEQLTAEEIEDIRAAAGRLGSEPGPAEGPASSGEEERDVQAEFAFSADRFLPDRISRRDVERYAKQLRLSEDLVPVLDVLHTDYLERLSTLDVLDELRDARAASGESAVEDAGESGRRVAALRRRAIEAMASVDTAFFEDLGTIAGEANAPLVERVRRCRMRENRAGSASARLSLGRDVSNETSVDLVAVVLEAQPPEAELERVGELLDAYENDATAAFAARLEAQLALQRLTDRWLREIESASRTDIAAVLELQGRYREEMAGPTERVRRTDRVIVDLNRTMLERLGAELSPDLAGTIRRAYALEAFPSIYRDPAAVDRHLRVALDLDDLTGSQRERLIDVGAAYRGDYEDLSRKMIDQMPSSTVNAVGLDQEAFREWQRLQQQMAKIRFDRGELNARAISRLREILSEEQITRIGGLPELSGEDEFFFYR